jgi:hypothetical protein
MGGGLGCGSIESAQVIRILSSLPSPIGDQAETEDGLIAGNDGGNGVVANLLRDDSAGRAGSASAALGGVAYLGGLVHQVATTPPRE